MAVVGGGAAGFMTAITAAENGVKRIIILEGTSKLMEKVRISGGGRCNVTNATWIPHELVENYPRGGIQLLESFNRFAAGDVFDWFETVSYTHLTLPTIYLCRSRWSPYH